MKKIGIIILSFVISLASKAQSEDVIYLYMNNGDFNAFFCSDIDSITQSKADLQGKIHDDWNTQIIYTKDSVYKYDMSVIDSISFHAPATVYQPNVVLMDESWIPYINIVDTLVLSISNSFSNNKVKVGDVLITTDSGGMVEKCFAGRVSEIKDNVESTLYICEAVNIGDIYQKLVTFGRVNISPLEAGSAVRTRGGDGQSPKGSSYELPTIHSSIDLNDNLNLHYDHTPKMEIDYIVNCVNGKEIMKTRVVNTSDLSLGFSFNWEKKRSDGKPYEFKSKRVPIFAIPIVGPLNVFCDLCWFLDLNASVSFGADWDLSFSSIDESSYANGKVSQPVHSSKIDVKSPTANISLDGELYTGPMFYTGLRVGGGKSAGAGVTTKVGLACNGTVNLTSPNLFSGDFNTTIYTVIKDEKIAVEAKEEFGVFAEIFGKEFELPQMSLGYEQELLSRYVVPEFDDIKYSVNGNDVSLQTRASRDLFLKAQVGLALFDKDMNLVGGVEYFDYDKITELTISQNYHVEKSGVYTCYPVIRFMLPGRTEYNSPICASPYVEINIENGLSFCPDDNHPHMIDLGLPSGTKWACCNLGASSPENGGTYFAAGETSEKDDYSKETYSLFVNVDGRIRVQDLGPDISGTQYDAAYVNLGSPWRMPSKQDWEELIDNCEQIIGNDMKKKYELNGSLFIGPNGNYIFVPVIPIKSGKEVHKTGIGYYWTSSQSISSHYALWYMIQTSAYQTFQYMDMATFGAQIRPIAK